MSDKELIEKIENAHHRVRKIGPDAIYETELREVLRAAADALSARQPSENDLEAKAEALKEWQSNNEIRQYSEFYTSWEDGYEAGFSRAAVPDAATDAKQSEGWSTEDRQEAKREAERRWSRPAMRYAEQRYQAGNVNGFMLGAEWQKARETFISYKAIADKSQAERDAALAAIERVRAEADAYAEQPDVMELCGAVAQALRTALDGAPEPEWEYQCTNNINTTGLLADPELHAKQCAGRIERRRKAGPWLPVEGESK